ncbi:MAG: hypothetical protein ACYDGR_16745 [Candidatus Dormibacteria bacterium]
MSLTIVGLGSSPMVAHAAGDPGPLITYLTQTATGAADSASKVIGNCAFDVYAQNLAAATHYGEDSTCSDPVGMNIKVTLDSTGPIGWTTGTVPCQLSATTTCPADSYLSPTTLADYQTLTYHGEFTAPDGWTFNGTTYDTKNCTLSGQLLTCDLVVPFFVKYLGVSI